MMNQEHLYTANMVLDSVSIQGHRLSTIHVHMPRMILAEMNTHRALSKNTRSTRAVPTKVLIEEVRTNPYIPLLWLKNRPGMQGGDLMTEREAAVCECDWRHGARQAAALAHDLFDNGLHKQWAGRPLEPYMWVDTLLSGTEWANFMALRDHGDAQPEFQLIAQRIRDCLDDSTPRILKPGQWHLPYVDLYGDLSDGGIQDQIINAVCGTGGVGPREIDMCIDLATEISAARCARISVKPFDGEDTIEAELARFTKLVLAHPVHASPTEHQATPDEWIEVSEVASGWEHPELHGNFIGWIQHRKLIPFNTITEMPARRHELVTA